MTSELQQSEKIPSVYTFYLQHLRPLSEADLTNYLHSTLIEILYSTESDASLLRSVYSLFRVFSWGIQPCYKSPGQSFYDSIILTFCISGKSPQHELFQNLLTAREGVQHPSNIAAFAFCLFGSLNLR